MRKYSLVFLTIIVTFLAGACFAQDAPYEAVPNFSGASAGYNFRQSVNQRFSGAVPIEPRIEGAHYASLPSEQNGKLFWCNDCKQTTPCSSGGAGAWAFGRRGQWSCGYPALEADLNANGHNITGALSVQTANGPVETKDTGDANWRELLTPGTGVQVGNGTAAPYLAIDENANISGHVNGVINVKAPPYLAKGDGATDDTAAIQAAINTACAASGINKPEVYLPATPGGLFYHTTAPILVNCSIRFEGAGWTQTQIKQNYLGPTLIAQMAEPGWKPPLTASVTMTWQASHGYSPYQDVLDANGNVEVVEGGACTSGAGSHPTWPTTQPNTVTDNTCTWALATTGGGTQIATGAGSSLDAADPEFFNGAGYGGNNATMELGNPGNLEHQISALANFTVEFYVEPFFSDGGASDNFHFFDISSGEPRSSNISAFQTSIGGNGGGCTNNCLYVQANIGGSNVTMGGGSGPAAASLTINKIHHVAVTYDGSTLREFVDGVLANSQAASGTWTIPAYESFRLASRGSGLYPSGGNSTPLMPAFYDSLRISNTARYTSAFTPPTAKFSADANTLRTRQTFVRHKIGRAARNF